MAAAGGLPSLSFLSSAAESVMDAPKQPDPLPTADLLAAAAASVLRSTPAGVQRGAAPAPDWRQFSFGSERAPDGGLRVPQRTGTRRGAESEEPDARPKRRRVSATRTPPLRPAAAPLGPDDEPGTPRALSADAHSQSAARAGSADGDDGRKPFYHALGLRSDACPDDIHRAYRRLALRWHPDKNPNRRQEAERRFKELLLAYETLSDPARRRAYDRPVDPHELTALLGRLMSGRVSVREAPVCLQWVSSAIATLADRLDADLELQRLNQQPTLPEATRIGPEQKTIVDPNPLKDDPAEPAVTLIVLGLLFRAFNPDALGPWPPGLESNVERLQHHPSELVYALAYTVLLDHFELEDASNTHVPVGAPGTPTVGAVKQSVIPPLASLEALEQQPLPPV